MTPESARASNRAAYEAGWFASNWKHKGASEEARALTSERMKKHTKREQIMRILKKTNGLTTEAIRAKLLQPRQTVHMILQRMAEDGRLERRYTMIGGRKNAMWWLK
jgi:hypothetical protein